MAYGARQASDFGKLATLGSEGRATATTVLSLSTVLHLRKAELPREAQKLLSFTDNRQDASLQAGHFNDFVQTGLLRGALYRAVETAGLQGLRHDHLTQKVFEALGLELAEYASNPEVKFSGQKDTDRALRDVLGYRIYRDLLYGWRITAPNLEQVDLLRIGYESLDELCRAEEEWQGTHPALAGAAPEVREKVAKVLLDHLRRELAIKVDYLNPDFQERMRQASSARLIAPWALEENERLEYARVAYPRPSRPGDSREAVYISPRGSFGQYLRRSIIFPGYALKSADSEVIIKELLQRLSVAGLVEQVDADGGYQVVAAAFIWRPGDGSRPGLDPLRVHLREDAEREANRFFIEFYRLTAQNLGGLEAREHTAQVPSKEREQREEDFRAGRLPVLYCSPTMELGVDISTLNVVNMRNVPPTPANYAQRSGRAGRSGSPALVFTYAASGNSHDQYFFRRPRLMVAGAVSPPRLDLTNEELIRSHLQAVWLAATGADLGRSLAEILEVEGEEPTLALRPSVRDDLQRPAAVQNALERAKRVLADLMSELEKAPWYTPAWIEGVMEQAYARFEEACERWRTLYRAAREQFQVQSRVILDASRSAAEKDQARRLRSEAESQLRLLTETSELAQSDFYSYRYFASEGFLPGYSFPRLPLSAFIPARRRVSDRDEFLSRPRFLAITEFGPFSILYYEGSKYVINRVILPPGSEQQLRTSAVKRCDRCGYLHAVNQAGGPDLCMRCKAELPPPRNNLLRMHNVSTIRRERINSDEEERQRLGYQVLTGISFPPHGSQPAFQSAQVYQEGRLLAELTFSQAASIWRMNLGWAQRKNRKDEGFWLDPERGYWIKRPGDPEELDEQNPNSRRTVQVIPYVEDRKNALLLRPGPSLDEVQFYSLLYASTLESSLHKMPGRFMKNALSTHVKTVGGLLPSELLQRVAALDRELGGLEADDYHLVGERLPEAISRSWGRMLAVWASFRAAGAGLSAGDAAAERTDESLSRRESATGLTREKLLLPLFAELGYGRLPLARGLEVAGKPYPISHLWNGVPIHLVGVGVDLDRRTPGAVGAARQSPHGLVQEYLNRSEALWGFVSNGLKLRLLRDNAALTRQAYVEFDLEAIFEAEAYPDFALLWLLAHESRVYSEGKPPSECWLERWQQQGAEQGKRALERLREGVRAALLHLGEGFLAHPANTALKEALRGGRLTPQGYYRELLRLVYRLLFLFVAEDREVLLDPGPPRRPAAPTSSTTPPPACARLPSGSGAPTTPTSTTCTSGWRAGWPKGARPHWPSNRSTPCSSTRRPPPIFQRLSWPTGASSRPSARWPSPRTTRCCARWTTRTWGPRSWAASTSNCWSWCRRWTWPRPTSPCKASPATSARPPAATTPPRPWCRWCWTRPWSPAWRRP